MTASGSTAGTAGPTRSSYHHPYRLEVRGITPVSISLLWSLRPLPLSAIPRNVGRQGRLAGHNTALPGAQTALKSGAPVRGSPLHRIQAESGSGAPGASSSITATRSPNRRVTKVTLRNVSPAKRGRGVRSPASASATSLPRRDSGDWPSDDGATAVDEDDVLDGADVDAEKTQSSEQHHPHFLARSNMQDDDPVTPSEASDDPHPPSRILEAGVTVSVNGIPWSQVVVGDSGAEEAFIVVYGLQPSRDYELQLNVEDKHLSSISVATSEAEEKLTTDSAISASTAIGSADRGSPIAQSATGTTTQVPRIKRTHTPPMQDTDATVVETGDPSLPPSTGSVAVSHNFTASALQAAVRKARKDASRSESALRNEIEAIRRGLERMSDVDHRSKQKVLALQESIRQATTQAKDIDDEATAVEDEREEWEKREREKDSELERVRVDLEDKMRVSQAHIKEDAEEIEMMEKELQQITRSVEEKRAAKGRLETEKLIEVEQELGRIHVEIENTLRGPPATASSQFYTTAAAAAAQQQHGQPSFGQGTSTPLVPPQTTRGRGGRGGSRGGGRGGSGSGNATSRRHQHRHNRHHGHQQLQHSGGDDHLSSLSQQHMHEHGRLHSPHTSVLNPHKPEFVPSGAHGSAADSPLLTRPTMLPSVDHSPTTAGRFSFPSHVGDVDAPRRASTSHLDLSSNAMIGPSSSTWLPGAASPWTHASSLAPSPQTGHDIWGVSAAPHTSSGSSPLIGHDPAAPGGSTSGLRTKTSIPFGLNASLLRGGANPSFTRSRRGNDMFAPHASASGLSGMHGGQENGMLHVFPTSNVDGSSAPVSPTRPHFDVPADLFGEQTFTEGSR